MITRFNTNRESTRQQIYASILGLLLLAILPLAQIIDSPNASVSTCILLAIELLGGGGLLLLLYWVYRYYQWNEQDDVYLLSGRTLAILRPGKPVRFVKPRDIVALKPDGMKMLLADGTPLSLPRYVPESGTIPLHQLIVIKWFGKESIEAAKATYRRAFRPSACAIFACILLVAGLLLAALGLALAGMWREFAGFSYWVFMVGQVVGGLYAFALAYYASKTVYPLLPPTTLLPDTGLARPVAPSPRSRGRVEILRLPEEQPRAIDHVGIVLLVLLGLCVFIPICQLALSYDAIEQETRVLVRLVAVDLTLVAAYSIWRLYQTVIRGEIFVSVLLSQRTLAIVRPRRSVIFLKPIECAALVCGSNKMVLKDGRVLTLSQDTQFDEGRSICRTICKQWWPDVYGEEPQGIVAMISNHCRRQIAVGILILAVGVVMLILDPSPWGTAIAHHFIVPGAAYALYGYWRGLRGHGRVIELSTPAGGQQADV